MKQRNWLDLSRKLVDRYDLDFTLSGMSEILGKYALTFFGEGVKVTTEFPNPFPIALSNVDLTGSVGPGIGYDYKGNYTSIPSGVGSFTIGVASSQVRHDLLVIRYKQTGDTLIPKPSDPITMVDLNLHDDFELAIVPGVPSGTPVYPAKGMADIILAGIIVPIGAIHASDCSVDLTIREVGFADNAKYPVFKQESLIGTVDGTNTVFTLSETPVSGSVLISEDGLTDAVSTEYSVSGQTVTFVNAPVPGRIPYAWYVVMDESSTNPLASAQETPVGNVDGSNGKFFFAGKPASKDSTLVFIDGILTSPTAWTLTQSSVSSSMDFTAGNIPQIGQSVYVFYLVNPATMGTAPGGGSSGIDSLENIGTGLGIFAALVGASAKLKSILQGPGINITDDGDTLTISAPGISGGYTVYGTPAAPEIVTTGVINPNSDQRQIWFLKSNGGNVSCSIAAGISLGQELSIRGTNDADSITIEDGSGVSQNGDVLINSKQAINYFWNGVVWDEQSRRL